MEADIRHMKWWGWGDEDVTFDDSTKPELWPYLKRELGVDEIRWEKPVAFEDVTLPEQKNNEAFLAAIGAGLGEGQVVDDKKSRLVHAAGKSFRDLWLMRHGQVQFAPDYVVYPDTEEDVALVVRAALSMWLLWLLQRMNGGSGSLSRPSVRSGHQKLKSSVPKIRKPRWPSQALPRGGSRRNANSSWSAASFNSS